MKAAASARRPGGRAYVFSDPLVAGASVSDELLRLKPEGDFGYRGLACVGAGNEAASNLLRLVEPDLAWGDARR